MGVYDKMGKVTKATRSRAEEIVDYVASKGYKLTRIWGMGSSGSEHPTGRALDFMITGPGLGMVVGNLIASYLWKNRKRLGVKWVIWDEHIRSTSPGKSGRWEDYRGASKHEDHVHVFFGTGAYVAPPVAGGGGGSAVKVVDLSQLIEAAERDTDRKQGGTTPGAADDVKIVEAALKAEGLLSARYARDGSFGSLTVKAYSKWQESKAGGSYRGKDSDGIPGRKSLERLGKRNGFKVRS
ncbi:hypothetical protein [Microlunatus parietis]|uniref:ARB-07466-like C-terminal domain-containing protein n=1 Tax=Microlunatus parietis TaxID=682979 RepID=A0A7Y9I255_9ACTN|nr:hypothetical protein [Microlunatus parietis]NYE68855.1 hypothetical protein [Microlunatus parietis]